MSGWKDKPDYWAEELLYGNGICVIEWSNVVEDVLPRDKRVSISIKILESGERLISVKGLKCELS